MRTKEEWDRWYARPDPWGTEGTDKDRVREEILLDRLRHARFENLLEIGCGEGRLTHALSALARRTRAFDISQAALGRASARYPGIEFEQGDMLDVLARPDILAFPFDFVSVSEVLYYFQSDEERAAAVAALARVGVPQCLYYMSVIVTGNTLHRRYFTHDEFLSLVAPHFNVIDTFASVADMPAPLDLLRRRLPRESRVAMLKRWTAARRTEDCRHLGCLAVKRFAAG